MAEQPGRAAESSLTLQRALTLLQALADAPGESLSISELADAIGISRAAVYRLLDPLAHKDLIWRDGARVRLGLGLLLFAERVLPQLRSAAIPALRDLAERLGATAHLSVLQGGEVTAVATIEPSWTPYHVGYRVGTKHAPQLGAAGRALSLPANGPQWIVSTGELQAGACGVAAPLRGVPGLRASVGVVSLHELDADLIGPEVVKTAELIAAALR
ncbi:MAG: IclR family transcriptional regulator [Sciscionella sp.]